VTYGAEFWTLTNKLQRVVKENSEKNIWTNIRELLCENENVNKKFITNLNLQIL